MEKNYLDDKKDDKFLFIIPYLVEEYFIETLKSVKKFYKNAEIIGIYGKTIEGLKSYEKCAWVFLNKILPVVGYRDFYYIEEGVILQKELPVKESSYWYSYTKWNPVRPVGCKIMFFKCHHLYIIEDRLKERLTHIDEIFSKIDLIEIADYKLYGRSKIPAITYFKLIKRNSNFKTKHPKIHYI